MTSEEWGQVQSGLRRTLGKSNYANWIEPLEFVDVKDGVARFLVPTDFLGNWVERNFADKILAQMGSMGIAVSRLAFSAPPASARKPVSAPSAPGAGAGVPGAASGIAGRAGRALHGAGRPLPGAPLDERFTFENFVVGKPNELAHAAARRVAEGEGRPVGFNPLFLYGGVGLGKTHLMHAIAWELRARRPEMQVLYLSAEQFMYSFVRALRDKQMLDFKQLFRSVDVLMVDDIQFIAGKDSTQEEFFHTFNALVDQNKQIILSADRAPGEIAGIEERIRSRMQSGLIADLHPTDYELRLGVLQQRLDKYREQYPDVQMADGVLEFLAQRICASIRVLEGALMRLFAFASLVGREITLDMTRDCLADTLRASDRKVTVEEIQRKVSEHYNIRLSDLIGPRRLRTIARPRQVAMYLAKQLTSRSLPEIGRRFGNRDHTTVMHGVRRIEELKAIDHQIAEDLEILRRSLEE